MPMTPSSSLIFFPPLVMLCRALAWPHERLRLAQLKFIAEGDVCSASPPLHQTHPIGPSHQPPR
jgi:hypothetical protein